MLACVLLGLGAAFALLAGCPATRSGALGPSTQSQGVRVAAMAPGVAAILRDLGLGDRIVARHGYDPFTDASVPVAGEQERIDYEALLRTRPTHVILQWGERPLPARLVDLSLEHRFTLISLPMLTLEDIRAAIVRLGTDLIPPDPVPGFEKNGLDRLLPKWDRAMAHRAGAEPGRIGRVLLLYGASPPAALGPGSYHAQILERLGATPAVAQGAPFMPMDAEDVLRLAPDAIVVIQPREPHMPPFPTPLDASTLAPILGTLARLDIPAVRRGRVALIDDPMALIPGSNLIEFADRLGEVLMHWHSGSPR